MRILIVSGYFPPFAPMSGVRAGKLAKYLLARGHDVRVLCAKNLPYPPLLPLEIPEDNVRYADWLDVNALPKRVASFRNRLRGAPSAGGAAKKAEAAPAEAKPGTGKSGLALVLDRLRLLYTDITNWPDAQIGWLPYALADGGKLLSEWRADLIYATVPPLTGLLVARRLARRFDIPWIAEFRDLWVDHPYYDAPPWRSWLERIQEARTLAAASALVTVSDPWRDILEARFHKPTLTVLNGFDPDDYPEEPPRVAANQELTILYTGTLYPGRRDPTPLFQAVARLGDRARSVRMQFYGADRAAVMQLAEKAGVVGQAEVFAPVGYQRVVELQRAADILLMLRWNDPSELGVVPGKLFEYIGARRPILCLGFDQGAVPDIIRSRDLGVISEDPDVIAKALLRWLDQKCQGGRIAPLPLEARTGLSRSDQFETLERFMQDAIAAYRTGTR